MLPEMFVNELSLVPVAVEVEVGHRLAEQFVLTVVAAQKRGFGNALRMSEDFHSRPIVEGYDWRAWSSDKRVDLEIRRYFRSIVTKAPFLHDEPDVEQEWRDADCYWQTQPALGLKAALIADGLALSLASCREWDNPLITCEIQRITDAEVTCMQEVVHHASAVQHLDYQRDWLEHRILTATMSGETLWRHMPDLFPALACCAELEGQLENLPHQSLVSIKRGLFRLNAFCAGWRSGPFDPNLIGCMVSPESPSTLRQYGAERTFLCPDGRTRVFSWHAKLGDWRIHFDPDAGPGRLFVGYVGRHLRTVRFN